MRTRFKPALAHRIAVVPKIQTPRNTNFICGGGIALFLPTKPPDQRPMVPNPKTDIQIVGKRHFAQNVQADDTVLSCTILPCFSRSLIMIGTAQNKPRTASPKCR